MEAQCLSGLLIRNHARMICQGDCDAAASLLLSAMSYAANMQLVGGAVASVGLSRGSLECSMLVHLFSRPAYHGI